MLISLGRLLSWCLAKRVSPDSAKSKLPVLQKMVMGREKCILEKLTEEKRKLFFFYFQWLLYLKIIYSSSHISMFWKLVFIKNDLPNVVGTPYVVSLLTTKHLLTAWCAWSVHTVSPSQLLSVQGTVGTRACLRARPQSEAEWPAKPHRSRLLPSGCVSGQHGAHATSHHQPVPFCDPLHRQGPHQAG